MSRSSTPDHDNASQTTEDDPQLLKLAENQVLTGLTTESLHAPSNITTASKDVQSASNIEAGLKEADAPRTRKPNYELRYTMAGHTMSISSVKFSPDGKLLGSCGAYPLAFIFATNLRT
jgi:COMPASS component SWD3